MIIQQDIEILMKVGQNADKSDSHILGLLEPIRKHDFINRQAPSKWAAVTEQLPVDQHIALFKGVVLAEKTFKWINNNVHKKSIHYDKV